MSEVNSMYFSREDVKEGLMTKLLDYLCNYSYTADDDYCDIHIYPCDCGAFTVEWVQAPCSHDYGSRFECVNEDQVVCTELQLPDGTWVTVPNPDEFMEEWLEDNPGWHKNDYGCWVCDNLKEPVIY